MILVITAQLHCYHISDSTTNFNRRYLFMFILLLSLEVAWAQSCIDIAVTIFNVEACCSSYCPLSKQLLLLLIFTAFHVLCNFVVDAASRTAPLYLPTLWRYTNAVVIIIVDPADSCCSPELAVYQIPITTCEKMVGNSSAAWVCICMLSPTVSSCIYVPPLHQTLPSTQHAVKLSVAERRPDITLRTFRWGLSLLSSRKYDNCSYVPRTGRHRTSPTSESN